MPDSGLLSSQVTSPVSCACEMTQNLCPDARHIPNWKLKVCLVCILGRDPLPSGSRFLGAAAAPRNGMNVASEDLHIPLSLCVSPLTVNLHTGSSVRVKSCEEYLPGKRRARYLS